MTASTGFAGRTGPFTRLDFKVKRCSVHTPHVPPKWWWALPNSWGPKPCTRAIGSIRPQGTGRLENDSVDRDARGTQSKVQEFMLKCCRRLMDICQVLLPPGTAAMYEQLLKLESYEITKKTSTPSDRLLEIRHLKERMIRKCQHLAKLPEGTSQKRASMALFQTVVAEADFRMKSMEKFFRDEQKRLAVRAQASRKPEPPKHTTPSKQLVIANPPLVIRSTTNPQPKEKPRSASKPHTSVPERSVSLPAAPAAPDASAAVEAINSPPPRITSPPPLPILLLSQREDYGLDLPPDPASEKPSPLLPFPEDAEGTASPPAQDGDVSSGKQLQRRPSCIRRRSSLSDLVKRVSWADSQALDQQLAQYAISMKNPQNPGMFPLSYYWLTILILP
jgi:hypothetical protein